MFLFQKIWRALFSWNNRFEICPFALLLTFYRTRKDESVSQPRSHPVADWFQYDELIDLT